MTNWSTLNTFEDWAGKLDELLDAGDQALRSDDVSRQIEVMKTLRAFRRESPNDTCRRLDEIAKQAVLDMAASSLQAGIGGIAARSAELDDYLRDVNLAASETRRTASWLSLETPTEVSKSLTEMIGALKELNADAKRLSGGNKEVKTDIVKRSDAVIAAVSKLRALFEGTV